MDNPCPAYIGCAGDCNECSYIGDDKMGRDDCNMCEEITNKREAHLQAELKLYKRALDLACDDLHSSLKFNYGYADENLVNHFITKAKED